MITKRNKFFGLLNVHAFLIVKNNYRKEQERGLSMNTKKQLVGNSYYGDKALNYFEKRKCKKSFIAEQQVFEELLSGMPKDSKVLDIPFGTGRFVEFYLKKNMDIYGLEISGDMINAAKELLGESFESCNVKKGDATQKLPFEDNYFDLIVSFRFLKFFPYYTAKEILKEFHRVTKSKAILRMVVRRDNEPDKYLSEEYLESLDKIKGNIYEKDLIKLFNEVGFKVEKSVSVKEKSKELFSNNVKNSSFKTIYKHIKNGSLLSTLKKKIKSNKKQDERVVYQLSIDDK